MLGLKMKDNFINTLISSAIFCHCMSSAALVTSWKQKDKKQQ